MMVYYLRRFKLIHRDWDYGILSVRYADEVGAIILADISHPQPALSQGIY